MFTCNWKGWEWEDPEEGSVPGEKCAGVQSLRPVRAALEASPEIKWNIEDWNAQLPETEAN